MPGPRRRRWVAAIAVAAPLLFVLAPSPAPGAPSDGPNSHQQPLEDGCQRSNAMDLTLSTPEWVYVGRQDVLAARGAGDPSAGSETVEGVVSDIHPAGDDLYVNHDYNDVDIGVAVDPQYLKFVGSGNGDGQIGTEWEGALIPTWAWPQVGDRVRESGSWIWDCGHWGNGPADDTHGVSQLLPYDPVETGKDFVAPGAISGEQTELHPLYEVATWRKDAAGLLQGVKGGRDLQHLDVWISGDGGPALSEEECALYGVPMGAAAPLTCPRYRDVGGTYTYTLNVGPGHGDLVVNPVVVHEETDPALRSTPVTVTSDPAQGQVKLSFTLPHSSDRQRFGITVEAGWSKGRKAVHHVVTLDSITVNASLDGDTEPSLNPLTGGAPPELRNSALKERTEDPGEWVLYVSVNGHWWQMDPSKIAQPSLDDPIALNHVFDIWLPAGVLPTLYVSGRECDIPLIDCTQERWDGPYSDHTFHELGFNDKPGRVQLGNTGLPLTRGQRTYEPIVNPDPNTSIEDFSDATCGGPCYSVTVTSS